MELNLNNLCRKYDCDKCLDTHKYNGKTYCDIYQKHFDSIRHNVKKIYFYLLGRPGCQKNLGNRGVGVQIAAKMGQNTAWIATRTRLKKIAPRRAPRAVWKGKAEGRPKSGSWWKWGGDRLPFLITSQLFFRTTEDAPAFCVFFRRKSLFRRCRRPDRWLVIGAVTQREVFC